MTKTILLYCYLLFWIVAPKSTTEATKELPVAIKTSFESLFPKAMEVDWEEDETEYYLYFENEAHNTEAFFSKTGKWIQTNIFIEYAELPDPAKIFIEKHYKEDIPYFEGILRIETPEARHYVVTFESEGAGINLLFADTGNLVAEN